MYYVVIRMNVRVDALYWMDECSLNKRPTMICLAGKKKEKKKKKKAFIFNLMCFDIIMCVDCRVNFVTDRLTDSVEDFAGRGRGQVPSAPEEVCYHP